jgi:hypothetical protein
MSRYKFTSLRVKSLSEHPNVPDYSNIINLNGKYFTLIGYLKDLKADIDYTLELITDERLKKDKYLKSKYAEFISQERIKNV